MLRLNEVAEAPDSSNIPGEKLHLNITTTPQQHHDRTATKPQHQKNATATPQQNHNTITTPQQHHNNICDIRRRGYVQGDSDTS
jgi:hypothetical protein